ncbi:MAG: rod shape-determining protein MreC [Bacteroidales bacterium]|jgi:rod shape-determining protein MreC|nr:rod shape-determining protein MreC [Bacteroidales bacterium]
MNKLFDILKRYDYVVLFVVLVALSIVLMSRTSYYQQSKIVSWANGIAGGWYEGVNSIGGYFGLKAENDRLAAENARLHARLAESYISYTDSVFTINDTVYRQRYDYTEAAVIKSSWNGQHNYLMIGKGRRGGVEPDMAVISPDGIVGVVVATTANFATVMPVLHPDSRNSVKVKRTGVSGSLVWDGKDFRYAQVLEVPTTHQFVEGDTIVTSGLANDFPEGILVGYVVSAEPLKGEGFYEVRIRLATDFSKLEHVYVIDNKFSREQRELTDGKQ